MMCASVHLFKTVVVVIVLVIQIHGQSLEEIIDQYVTQVLDCSGIPGLSLAVVRNGQNFLAKGYGSRRVGDPSLPVTNSTLFCINSCTKAFTGMTAATVIRNNPQTIGWLTPIRTIIGDWLYMNDTVRTQEVNLRDLLSHRVGLPRNDIYRVNTHETEEETVRRFQYLPYSAEFRDVYTYNNLMFGLAAYTLQVIEGRSWEEIADERIFKPLGMSSTTFIRNQLVWGEMSYPHALDGDQLREISLDVSNAYYHGMFSASGGIVTNALDILKWMKFQLSNGTTEDGTVILTSSQFEQTHRPRNHRASGPAYERPADPVTYGNGQYSTGWEENTYRDYLISQHYGGLAGFCSLHTRMPSVNHAIFTNLNVDPDFGVRDYVHMYIMDLLLGEVPWLGANDTCARIQQNAASYRREKGATSRRPSPTNEQTSHGKASAANSPWKYRVDEYFTGMYGHHAYGNLTIATNSTTGGMYMVYGREGWTWNMIASDGDNTTYTAAGNEPIWYDYRSLTFDGAGSAQARWLLVNFEDESEVETRFDRDLSMATAPTPPPLC